MLPKGSSHLQDAGFQVFSVDDVLIFQPMKKKKWKDLTDEEKDKNRRISKIRMKIEHVVSSIKRCRIVKDKFRNWLRGFADTVMDIACSLHNFSLKFRPWQEVNADDLQKSI